MKNFGIKTDRALDFLVGEVKYTTNKTFEIKDGVKELSDHSTREYNSDGHRSTAIYYENGDNIRLRQVSIFDENGNEIGYTNYNANDLRDSYGKYELDYEGRIIRKYHNGEVEETYKYDYNNNIIEVYYPNTGGRDLYEYNEKGLVTKQLSISGENSMFGSLFGGPKRKLTTFINDHWGNIVEMKVFDEETNDLLFTQRNTINNQGDEIESIGYKADGSVHAHVQYEYKYDNEGNWVSKKTITKEGLVYREQERVINYYSNDITNDKQSEDENTKDAWRFKKDKSRNMKTIKIVEKFQGQGMMKLLDEPWQKLIKLEEGTFTKTQTSIEFKTTDGHTVTADITNVYEEDDQKISYWGNMNDVGGPQILVDKIKSKKEFYVLRSFYPESFFVAFTTDTNYQTTPKLPFEIDNIQFLSDNHIRYQKEQIVVTSSSDSQGHNKGANRGIQIESNTNGGEGYTVTIYNMDGNHPLWGNNVQMAPKKMKLVSVDKQKVELRGYGNDAMGGSFADYGLTIYHNGSEPTKIKLHMHDRNVDIEYFKSNKILNQEPEIIQFAVKAATNFQNENLSEAKKYLIQIYKSVKSNPEQLKKVSDFESLSKAFYLMISMNLSDDIDVLQMMISLGYLCVTKAILNDKENVNLYKDRLLLLRIGHEPFKYTVMSALDLNADGLASFSFQQAPLKARDAIYQMEIADLELNPIFYQQVDFFNQRLNEFNEMIEGEFFLPERTKDEIVKKGIENHKKLFDYLENKVIKQGDIDF